MPFFVYILRNSKSQLYIGYINDLDRRVRQHQENKAGWTRGKGPWTLVHYETFADRLEAMRRERNLKRGRTNQELRTWLAKGCWQPAQMGQFGTREIRGVEEPG